MKFAVSALALFLLATLATAGDCLTAGAAYAPQAQFAPACTTGGCYAVQAAPVYAPVQQQVIVQRQVQYVPQVQQVVVQRQVYAAPVVQQAFVQKQVVVRQQAVYGGGFQQAQFGGFRQRQFVGGGFGGGPFRQGFQQAGILGGLERLTGLGDGSGQVGRGIILGGLAVRSNLFGLGR